MKVEVHYVHFDPAELIPAYQIVEDDDIITAEADTPQEAIDLAMDMYPETPLHVNINPHNLDLH